MLFRSRVSMSRSDSFALDRSPLMLWVSSLTPQMHTTRPATMIIGDAVAKGISLPVALSWRRSRVSSANKIKFCSRRRRRSNHRSCRNAGKIV